MSTLTPPILTPADVERACERDQKRYELIEGVLREKAVGARALFIAGQICGRLNDAYYPGQGFAAVGALTYCFDRPDHGRKPDVVFVWGRRLPGGRIPQGDLLIAPDLVAEVLSTANMALEVEDRLNDYLSAGVPLVWIANSDRRTIRVYRNDGTTRMFRAADVIENESLLPGLRLTVGDVFPAAAGS